MNGQTSVLLVMVIVGLTVVVGTVGVSSITATHNADVTTTTDRDGYLGFEQTTYTENGSTMLELAVTNQQSSGAAFSAVSVTLDGTTVDIAGPLEPGATATHTFTSVSCEKPVSIHASGTDMDIRMTRPVDC